MSHGGPYEERKKSFFLVQSALIEIPDYIFWTTCIPTFVCVMKLVISFGVVVVLVHSQEKISLDFLGENL